MPNVEGAQLEEEISLQDVILRIWARRGLSAGLVLLAVLGVGAWTMLSQGSSSDSIVYYIKLKGIEKGQYPGGAAFSPNDLRSSEVLRSAIKAVGGDLERVSDIADAFLIEYGSPESEGIVRKHKERLSVKNLSSTELDVRNAEFKDELEMATGSSLHLEISPDAAGLDSASAKRLLQEIPAQWSSIYSERYRIYEVPGLKVSSASLKEGSLKDSASIIGAIWVLTAMEQGLDKMAKDNRISYLVNSFGQSPSELLQKLYVFRSTEFRPLSIAILGKSDPVTDSYRSELQLEIDYLGAQISSYGLIAEQLSSGREGPAAEWAQSADNAAVNQLQLSGDSLGTIIGLAERASSAEFLRDILMERHQLETLLASTKVQLARVEASSSFAPTEEFVGRVETSFSLLARQYESLYSISIEKLRTELGTLYSTSAAPMKSGGVDLRRLMMRLVGAILAALFFGVLAAFVMPDLRGLSKRST